MKTRTGSKLKIQAFFNCQLTTILNLLVLAYPQIKNYQLNLNFACPLDPRLRIAAIMAPCLKARFLGSHLLEFFSPLDLTTVTKDHLGMLDRHY